MQTLCSPLPYHSNSAALFQSFADEPFSAFLDSGRPFGKQGRFDILTAAPHTTLISEASLTRISHANTVETSKADPFLLVKKTLGEHEKKTGELPFYGGAIAYFGYELAYQIEKLPSPVVSDLSMPDMIVGIYDWACVVDHERQKSFLVSHDPSEETVAKWDRLLEQFHSPALAGSDESYQLDPFQSNMTEQFYEQAFYKIKNYLTEGDCYQVNLAQRFSAKMQGSAWGLYKKLREKNPAAFGAFLNYPQGAVLSLSPERFLKTQGRTVETKPMKGTRPRGGDPKQDAALAKALTESEKDRAENVMIVDLLRNDLGKVCTVGSVTVPKLCELETFPAVHHLVSTVRGELPEDTHSLDVLRACFPGGSITGAPKVRAMEIINELEPQQRSVYCGAVAYIDASGDMDTNIAIRTLVHNNNTLYCWAGGGIVADSDCKEEYQETFDKVNVFLNEAKRTAPLE